MTTTEMTNLVVALLTWAGHSHVEAGPWEEDRSSIHVTAEGAPYTLLLSGDEIPDYTPGICVCDGLDPDEPGFFNVIAFWEANANQIPVPLYSEE
jgi:hypothetical protein